MNIDFEDLSARYRQDGYLVLPRLVTGDLLRELQETTRQLVKRAAAGELGHDPAFDVIEHADGKRTLRRVTDPERAAPAYDRIMRFDPLVDIVAHLLGGSARFDHGKLNFKPPGGGGALEWHQDWAFYPQTNDDMLAVGVMIEDCSLDNGPLMVIPGSHRGPVFDHHQEGSFVGGISARRLGAEIQKAVPLTGPAGSISIHHVRLLHGSTENRGSSDRPLLLCNYVAVDAFPIFHAYDWQEFNARILRGTKTNVPRVEALPIRVPLPAPKTDDRYSTGSIFALQERMEGGAIL